MARRCQRFFRRIAAILAAGAGLLPGGALSGAAGQDALPPAPIAGRVAMRGVSGAARLPGDRLLLVSDGALSVVVLRNATARLRTGRVEPQPAERLEHALREVIDLEDVEDAAWDGADGCYLVASHSREPRGDAPERRYRLARLRFGPTGALREARQSGALLQAIVDQIPFLTDSIRRPPARAGLNIEGLACDTAGRLWVGLRAPTVTESVLRPHGGQEDAVVLELENPAELFAGPADGGGARARLGEATKLDLKGQGIRGMAWDAERRACWILSGISVEPNHPVRAPWGLWLWSGTGAPREAPIPPGVSLEAPEAVCRFDWEGRPFLLLLEGGPEESRYALLPAPEGTRPAP